MKNNKGFSFFAILFFITILAGLVSIGLKIIPPYLDFVTITEATLQTLEQPRMNLQRDEVIMQKIGNQLSINNIRLGELPDDAITIRRRDGNLIGDIEYTQVAEMFSSESFVIELHLHFDKTVEARGSGE